MAGITPLSPAFKKVQIKPNFGDGDALKVSFPHYAGAIQLELKKNKEKLKGSVVLPAGIEAVLIWNEQKIELN